MAIKRDETPQEDRYWLMEDDDELRCPVCDFVIPARYATDDPLDTTVLAPSICPSCKCEMNKGVYRRIRYYDPPEVTN